ncbi:CapA family protein [Mesorhizobium sp. VK24D]|uniref:CapA family protein n=1 Tax=Mesorhizobium album TaxID=3072314 RepID=A0ABU4XZK7_9HYPH|nr:CapA family protein [Mesorhizobium sp. VK24D]MDX8480132.1 CapA family protein [Mesorhizobium sp. VK24D]
MEEHTRQDRSRQDQQGDNYDTVGSIATNVADGFTMVAVGDLIVSRPLTKGHPPGFGDIVKVLHDADVTFGNMEMNIFDIRSFEGSPQAEYGGAFHVSLPGVGPDLKAMGFNLVSRANNHTLDWGLEGMRETSHVLDQSGIIHAGAGENLAQAGAARFLETARGRVALVSLATSFTPMSRAGDPAGEAPGRPGLNALRLMQSIVVPPEKLESLRQIRDALPDSRPGGRSAPPAVSGVSTDQPEDPNDPNCVVVAGMAFKAGDKAGYSYAADPRDIADILRNVRRGKQFSDFCIVANHCHQPGNWSREPADYEQSFAYRLIDAGADAYVGHGPHQLRGIEIYKGRPIFYSLGNFFYDDLRTPVGADMFEAYGKDPRVDTDAEVTVDEEAKGYPTAEGFVGALAAPVFYESIVTVCRFEQNQLAELRLYPIELGYSKRFANRGVPRLAPAPQAKTILERLRKLSKPFGADIAIENDIGVIRLRPSPRNDRL